MKESVPCCAAHPRDEPYFVPSECEHCDGPLRLRDFRGDDTWWDEWECKECRRGIVLDVPQEFWDHIEQARKDIEEGNVSTLEDISDVLKFPEDVEDTDV